MSSTGIAGVLYATDGSSVDLMPARELAVSEQRSIVLRRAQGQGANPLLHRGGLMVPLIGSQELGRCHASAPSMSMGRPRTRRGRGVGAWAARDRRGEERARQTSQNSANSVGVGELYRDRLGASTRGSAGVRSGCFGAQQWLRGVTAGRRLLRAKKSV